MSPKSSKDTVRGGDDFGVKVYYSKGNVKKRGNGEYKGERERKELLEDETLKPSKQNIFFFKSVVL